MKRPRGRHVEVLRRAVVLSLVLLTLVGGLAAFYQRQSLVTTVRPYLLTRIWLPSMRLRPHAVAPAKGSANGVPVLVYHGIQPNGSTCNVTPETFLAHMTALRDAGYTTLTTDQFLSFMRKDLHLPERSVLVTFDDGRTDSFSGADPVLRQLGFHATMFTILGRTHSSKSFYLTAAETKMMARNGRWDVQSHTAGSHQFVASGPLDASGRALPTRKWDAAEQRLESDAEYVARVGADLRRAKAGIAGLTGRPVVALAYPWGDFGRDSGDPLIRSELPAIAQALYPITFTQAGATVDESYNYPSDLGTTLRRIYITYDTSAADLMKRLDRGLPKSLPFADETSFASSGWALSSGSFSSAGAKGRMLGADPKRPGTRAETFLDGSRSWRDYALGVSISLQTTETVSVVVRRQGPRDYVAATLSRSYVSIEQIRDDRVTTLAEADVTLPAGTAIPVEIAAQGTRVTLRIAGRTVAATDRIDPGLVSGGIGVRVEAPTGSIPPLALHGLRVSKLATAVSALDATGAVPGPAGGEEAPRD